MSLNGSGRFALLHGLCCADAWSSWSFGAVALLTCQLNWAVVACVGLDGRMFCRVASSLLGCADRVGSVELILDYAAFDYIVLLRVLA